MYEKFSVWRLTLLSAFKVKRHSGNVKVNNAVSRVFIETTQIQLFENFDHGSNQKV